MIIIEESKKVSQVSPGCLLQRNRLACFSRFVFHLFIFGQTLLLLLILLLLLLRLLYYQDDAEDNDGDGVKDVKQVAPKELMARKFRLVLRKMNPEKVDNALGELYRVWLSVSAVLAIQFARTISLALTIADSLDKPMNKHVAPVVKLAVPPEYQRWIPIVIGWVVKSVAMSFAFYVQSIVSATASALSGGLMMSQAIYHFCVARDFTLMGLLKENHADTYIDEVFAYVFAALGFYTQLRSGFDIKFPLNLVLFPFEWAEFWIRWTITRKVS